MQRMVMGLIFFVFLLVHFGAVELINAQSVDDFVEALNPIRTRGIKGVQSAKPNPQKAMHLQFGLNSAILTHQAKKQLKNLGLALEKEMLRHYVYRLEGHTCDRGTNEHNMVLSRQRAEAVKQFLTRNFALSSNQFQVTAFGETKPSVPNKDEAARRQNRRVMIVNTLQKFEKKASNDSATLQIKRLRDGKPEPLNDGEIIRESDQYAVEFKAGADPYVYIFQLDSKGNLAMIFPNNKISSMNNPVIPGNVYRLPKPGKWFYLDENKGKEQVFFLAKKEPLQDPIATAKIVVTGKRGLGGIYKNPQDAAKPDSQPQNNPRPKSELKVLKRYFIHQ